MLRIHTSKSAGEAKRYFIASHSKETYYSEGQEFSGLWGGRGAEMLGLQGAVGKKAFDRLCDNLHPQTGEKLTVRMNENRRVGFDVNFNCPKSVSLLHAYTGDDRLLWAMRQAAKETMLEMQDQAAVRVRAGREKSEDMNRTTGNLAWAEFVHLTARPEQGFPDPHLHCHMYVFNATFDTVEGRWKALQMVDIHEDADNYQKMFLRKLADLCKGLGLEIENTKRGFEIAGVVQELKDRFSRRTKKIEETAERLGITDPEQKSKLGAMTREGKNKSIKVSDLREFWWTGVPEHEMEGLKRAAGLLQRNAVAQWGGRLNREMEFPDGSAGKQSSELLGLGGKAVGWKTWESKRSLNARTAPQDAMERTAEVTQDDRRALALAMEHLFERESAVTERKLLCEAFQSWCVGKTTEYGIRKALAEADLVRRVVNGKRYVTTREICEEEDRIVQRAFEGRSKHEPMNSHWKIEDTALTGEQRAAVLHVLNSKDFVTGIMGNPGVGKTRALKELRRGIEAGCNKLLVLAPWGVSVNDVLRKSGFENAQTVARLLSDPGLQEQAKGAVVLVDEAGLLSCPEGDELLGLAQRLGARLVLVGDSGQHHPVRRGRPFDLLENTRMMDVAKITKIMRQKGEYRQVVEMILAGKTGDAIELLEEKGWIHELGTAQRIEAVSREYAKALKAGINTQLIAPTHVERHAVTGAVREELKRLGVLRPATQEVPWTYERKKDPASYRKGMRIEMEETVGRFQVGEQLEVIGIGDGLVRVRGVHGDEGRTRALPLDNPESFRVRTGIRENKCEWEILRNVSWTDAQKSDAEKYKPGQVVQINRHLEGFQLGEQVEVIGRRGESVRVRVERGGREGIKELPLSAPGSFSVYEKDRIEICEGERLRMTGNGRTKDGRRLNNGSFHTVDYIGVDGCIVLQNGERIDRNWKHFEYSYTLTSHSSQGVTVDRLFILQSAEMSFGAMDARQFLVSVSRGCRDVQIYTDDINILRERVEKLRPRIMASELVIAAGCEKEEPELRGSDKHLGTIPFQKQIGAELNGDQRPASGLEQDSGGQREWEEFWKRLGLSFGPEREETREDLALEI